MTKYFLRIFSLILCLYCSPYANAITYPNCDPSNPNIPSDCKHNNVAFLSIFDTSTNLTVAGTRCSGSVIKKDVINNKVIFLTAAHCAREWLDILADDPKGFTLGISMDPITFHLETDPNSFNSSQFLTGVTPVMYRYAGQGSSSTLGGNPYNVEDYAAVYANLNDFLTFAPGWETKVIEQSLFQDQSVYKSMEDIVATYKFPNKDLHFSAAGYGVLQLVDFPGKLNGGGAGVDRSTLGTLRESKNQTFRNLHALTIYTSQNPALGNSGTCGGDSGGPNYYVMPNGKEIQVGITSAGDTACRSTSTITRIDTPIAIEFINCVKLATSVSAFKGCGLSN